MRTKKTDQTPKNLKHVTLKKSTALIKAKNSPTSPLARKAGMLLPILYEKHGETIKTSYTELADMLGISIGGYNFERIDKSFKAVARTIIILRHKNIKIDAPLISLFKRDEKTGKVTIKINPELKEIIGTKKDFALLKLGDIQELKSIYALTLYDIYKKYRALNRPIAIPFDDMQDILNTKYKYAGELTRSLKAGQKELLTKLNISIDIEYYKYIKKYMFIFDYKP